MRNRNNIQIDGNGSTFKERYPNYYKYLIGYCNIHDKNIEELTKMYTEEQLKSYDNTCKNLRWTS